MFTVSPGEKVIGVVGEIDRIENPSVVIVIDMICSELGDVL